MRALVAAVVLLALPATASAAYVVRTQDFRVTKVGPLETKRYATVGRAVRVFGEPDGRSLNRFGTCRVRWERLGLVMYFENFGGVPEGKTTCSDRWGYAQTFKATGRRFASTGGVRPGTRSRKVPRLHRGATRRGSGWWLEAAVFPFGDSSREYPVLRAAVRGGRVRALAGYIGGAGE
jgi:hypothetical protein